MQKPKNLGSSQGYNRYNGTEGGGAGAYQTSQMRICPQGGQQQDPKQQPQQTAVPAGGMQHNMYPNRQNAMNYYQPRGSSHNQRMTAQPRPMNVVYPAHGASMNTPIYMQQMVFPQNVAYNMQQPARHQSHGAGTPNPQAANITISPGYYVPNTQQQIQNFPYAPQYLQMPMRNQPAVPNSAQFSQQQQPQQLQVAQQTLSNPAGQSMVTLMPQNAPSGMPVSHQVQHNQNRPKRRPEKALRIIHPVTGEDISKELWENNEGSEERMSASVTPQPEESIEKATVAAEFASKVAVAVSSDSPLVQSEAIANGPSCRSVSPPAEQPQPLKLPISEQIPTVSAKTNSPTVELHRHQPATKTSPLVQPHYLPQQMHIPLNNPQPISQPISQPLYSPPSPSPPPQQPQAQPLTQPQTQPQPPLQRPPSPATKVDAPCIQGSSPTPKSQQVTQVQNEKAKLKKEEKPIVKKDSPKAQNISPPTPTQPQTPVVTASVSSLPRETTSKSEPVERQPSPALQVQPSIEDTNGETDDAVKAQQRPKANKQKKKDLNRKGVEKEGTDMDAFQVADEPVETSEDPPEVEKDVADSIVAAKNEENNKVSANNNNNESPDESQVIESMTIERSEPQLQYHYKESQWSPINTEGKKVYDREFLMEVRNNPLSIKRPENLANESLLRETPNVISSTRRLNSSSNSIGSLPKSDNMNSYTRSSSSQRGLSRQSGMRGSLPRPMGHGSMPKNMMKSGSSGYNMHGMYRDEPNLHKVANSWKPSRLINNTSLSEEDLKTEVLLKTMRGILNKLTPQKFDRLLDKVNKLDINTEERMKKVVDLVFEKAIDEPSFSTMYAQLCYSLQLMKVQVKEKTEEATPQSVGFRKVLLVKCQNEFEKTKEDELDIDARQKQIAETKDLEKKKELLLAYEEDERKIRIKSVGLVRFIGELYKKNMLTHNIMHTCITSLMEKTDEESLECLCKLLTTIGKDLESKSTSGEFNNYFATMTKLSHKSPDSKISSRIRFMLQDVIDLRANKWIPRRDENKPKTIEQIQRDAERETLLENFQSMSSNMNRSNRNDDRRRPQKNQVSEDGWLNVNKTRSSNYTLESHKLMNMKSGSEPENSLGKPGQFTLWSSGSKRQNTENKNFTSANKFDILQTQDDRKLPLYSGSGRKGVTPSPSIEKERAIAGVKAMRGSGSGPNSRESSRSRYGSSPATSISKEEKIRELEPKPQEEMTEELDEQLSRSTRLVIDEYFSNKNSDEAYESIQEVFSGNRLKIFIEKSLSHVTENTNAEKRARFANLLVILIKDKKSLPKNDVIEGFSTIMDNEDLITDLPLMWQYLAQLLAPLIAQEALDFQDFKLASKQIAKENVSKLLVEIITFLIKEKGPCWISTQWESCHLNIKDFIPDNENIDKFIADKKLGFLTGSAEYPLQPDESLTCEEIEEKLLKFLKNDTNKAIDHTCDWIKANVNEKTRGTTLVKALTRASIKGSLVKEKFCEKAFDVNMRLIKKYVDNDEKYELSCLYAAQHLLANEIVSPPTVIQEIFESLYTSGTISYEGFMKWKETKSSEENEAGKGVLLSVLSSFFVMLSENSNDTEEES